jgi:hypothetical protein
MFPHTVQVSWSNAPGQNDWINHVITIDAWLDHYVGHSNWEYTTNVIAFRQAKHKTLYLLYWT